MSWPSKPLGELLILSGRDRAGDQDLPVLSITMKQGLVDQADKFKKRIASIDTANYRIAYRNELVVGFPIDEGVLGFQTKYLAGIVSPAYDIWRLKSEADCHIPYLERYLRSSEARSSYAARMQSAVARRRSLTKADFLNLEIPFPPLDDQARIAHLLGKVERLIARRKNHLQQLDDLLSSVFLEMFGDPVRNEKGWDKPELRAFGKISTGNTPSRNETANYDGEFIEWIKTDNITGDAVFVTPSTEHLSEVGARKARTVTDGALLVACIAGSVESIGRSALTDRNVAFNQQINAIQPGKDISSLYLYGLFKVSRAYIQSHATKGMKRILTKGEFEKIKMIKPPLENQYSFAIVAKKIEGVKCKSQKSLKDLETLYGSLSQAAFKGDLDLSRVRLTEEPEPKSSEAGSPQPPQSEAAAINLPETELMLAALDDREKLEALLGFWLEAYIEQLGDRAFSVDDFLRAAELRAAESFADRDFELGAEAYDLVKALVFDALGAGRLEQFYPSIEVRVALRKSPVFANV